MAMDPKLYQALFETFKGELTEQHQLMVDALIRLESSKDKKKSDELLGELFRISHNLKGSAKSVSLNNLAEIAHTLEDTFSNWREPGKSPTKKAINECLKNADEMLDSLKAKEAEMSASTFASDTMIQIPLRRVERVNAKLNELLIFQLRLSSWAKKMHDAMQAFNEIEDERLDKNKKALGGLNEDLEKLSSEFSRDLFILQQEGRSMCLLPISHLLSPLKRTIREIAEGLDKSVKLKVTGETVELDKSILDALKAPLQHLVRNAIAHGIESTEIRKKNNKPVPAILSIEACSEAGEIRLTVSDDGCGINIDALRSRALEKNLFTKEMLDNMSDKECLSLIFYSGLSTSKDVSELSGRGVGLDAVLADVKRVRGDITVDSAKDEGTAFTLTLPLAMSSARGLFIKTQDKTFMLPTVALKALYEIRAGSLERIDNRWVKLINKKPVSVFGLSHLLDLDNGLDMKQNHDGILMNVTEHGEKSEIIVLVEEIVGEHDCVVKPLPPPLDKLSHISGATLNETGELILALTPEYLLQKASSSHSLHLDAIENKTEASVPTLPQKQVKQVSCVLVVDDAVTTRSLAINALRAAGYKTIEAEDGQIAWKLMQNKAIDCVVTDLEMPNMDGFELIETIKKDEAFSKLPVIIVSCLDKPADKERGLKLGASAYLVKKDFDTRALTETVGAYL